LPYALSVVDHLEPGSFTDFGRRERNPIIGVVDPS